MPRTNARSLRAALCLGTAAIALEACGGKTDDRPRAGTSSGESTMQMDAAAMPRPMAKPDAQMPAVLDQLQALGGKPLPTLTAAEARKQPTPADAAKKEMTAEGKSTAPDPAVASVDRTIPSPNGALPVRI